MKLSLVSCSSLRLARTLVLLPFWLPPILHADAPAATDVPPKPLVDVAAAGSEARFVPDDQANNQVSVARSADPAGVLLTIAPGTGKFPGVWVKPADGKPGTFRPTATSRRGSRT